MFLIVATAFVIIMNSLISNIEMGDEEGITSYRNNILRSIILILYIGIVLSYCLGMRCE